MHVSSLRSLLILAAIPLFFSQSSAQLEFTEHTIDDELDGAHSVEVCDIDGDGDLDLLTTAFEADEIAWWENDGWGSFTPHTITDDFNETRHAVAADLDDDGDIDIIGVATGGDELAWWENDGEQEFEHHTIRENFTGACFISLFDMDDDGDLDIVAVAYESGELAWWENDGDAGFTYHRIATGLSTPVGCHAEDLTGNGYGDIFVAYFDDDAAAIWIQVQPNMFFENVFPDELPGACAVYICDLDQDDDMDLIGCMLTGNAIGWAENTGDMQFVSRVIHDHISGPRALDIVDLDQDGDLDLVAAAANGDMIVWYENDGEQDFEFDVIQEEFDEANYVASGDFDGDGDIDIVGVAARGDELTWWENLTVNPPGRFSLVEPEDSALVQDTVVSLEWRTAYDPDEGDEVTYTVYISEDEDFTDPVEIDAGTDTTATFEDCDDVTTYWWKVRAEDSFDNFRWSDETWSFTVDFPDPPGEFHLLEPEDGSEVIALPVLLHWEVPEDPDPEDTVRFTVFIDDDPEFIEPMEYNVGEDDTLSVEENLAEDVTYWWKVLAVDEFGEETWSAETWSFTINELHPPTDLAAELDTVSGAVTLNWNHDPGDAWFLEFKVYRDGEVMDRVDETTCTDSLEEAGEYRYWVTANYYAGETEAVDTVTVNWDPSGVADDLSGEIPDTWQLAALYPNPFNPAAHIVIGVPERNNVRVEIFDMLGRRVTVLADREFSPGYHRLTWKANGSSGVYFLRIDTPAGWSVIRKLLFIR